MLKCGRRARHALFLSLAASALHLAPASAQTLPQHPGTCAFAKRITIGDWELHNNCPFTVYWVVQCMFGDNFCAGVGRVIVRAGNVQDFQLGARTLLGPYNTP